MDDVTTVVLSQDDSPANTKGKKCSVQPETLSLESGGESTREHPILAPEGSNWQDYVEEIKCAYHNQYLKEEAYAVKHRCKLCGNTFTLKSNFAPHFKLFHVERIRELPVLVPEGSKWQDYVEEVECTDHNQYVRGRNLTVKHSCKLCGSTFTLRKNFVSHFKSFHTLSKTLKPYDCKTCRNKFHTIEECNKHEELHGLEQNRNCIQECSCVGGCLDGKQLSDAISQVCSEKSVLTNKSLNREKKIRRLDLIGDTSQYLNPISCVLSANWESDTYIPLETFAPNCKYKLREKLFKAKPNISRSRQKDI